MKKKSLAIALVTVFVVGAAMLFPFFERSDNQAEVDDFIE